LSFVVIGQYLTLEFGIFMKNFVFWTFFWINFSDIEMKRGMIAFNTELHIKFEFCSYWSIFDRVMGPWT
jgi:hypothetical protein